MSSCTVIIDGNEYDGEYNIEKDKLDVDIYNYSDDIEDDEEWVITSKEILIHDYRNKTFIYSPVFYHCKSTYGLTAYKTFQTDFYLKTSKYEDIKTFAPNSKIKSVTFYHPLFSKFFKNPCLTVKHSKEKIVSTLYIESEAKKVLIQNNNIDYIKFGGVYSFNHKRDWQQLVIETENYVQLYFSEPVSLDDVSWYIDEFDVFVNAYTLKSMRSFKTFVETDKSNQFELYHKMLGKEEYHRKMIRPIVKMDFFDFLEKMYKCVDYRKTDNRNKYLPFEFKKPTSLEDKFVYFFRYIDLYMGEFLKMETGKEPSNYDRISRFVDDNLALFESADVGDVNNFKNELNSLRNHYVHEGYYLPNNEFKVTQRKKLLYMKKMDYNWLYRVTQSLKHGVYKILYTKILEVDIEEDVLKHCK